MKSSGAIATKKKVQLFPVRIVTWQCLDGFRTYFTVRDWASWNRVRIVCSGCVDRPAKVGYGAFEM